MVTKGRPAASPLPSVDAQEHFERAAEVLVGGLSASARENTSLGRPLLAARGDGPWITTPDGKRYIDFHTGYGATMLGHNHPAVRSAIERALDMGIVHGPETVHQEQLARRIVEIIPSAELVRFANSGTEATMAAIRAARAFAGRDKLLKFEGHFHTYDVVVGHHGFGAAHGREVIDEALDRMDAACAVIASNSRARDGSS